MKTRKSFTTVNEHRNNKVIDRLPTTTTMMDDDCPSVVESEISSIASIPELSVLEQPAVVPKREPLQWEFKGLTIWLEFEEFDKDLTKANEFISGKYGTETIPLVHATAIYGMEHFTHEEAIERMSRVKDVLPKGNWPVMDAPVAIRQDIAEEGKPGQVCTISWAELSLRSNEYHEEAMDALCDLFQVDRSGPWTPHISLAYDNPENTVLNLSEIISHAMAMPTLLRNKRRVKALSLWNTVGKMSEWHCLERIHLIDEDAPDS